MKSGASAAKREAKKAAANQYYSEFAKVQPVDDYTRIASDNLRSIEDEVGDTSGTSRNQARKLDSLASQIKKDPELSKLTGLFNARYDILKQQISGQKSNKLYQVNTGEGSGGRSGSGSSITNVNGMAGSAATTSNNPSGMSGQVATPNGGILSIGQGKPRNTIDVANTYTNEKDAQIAAQAAADKMNAKLPAGSTQVDSSTLIGQVDMPKFGILYRNLNLAEDAAADLNNISSQINKSAGAGKLEQYSSIAEQLRKRLQNEANSTTSGPTGLLATSQEVLTGTPYTETIR